MDGDEDLAVPAECVTWCREQDVGVMVGDDMAKVDLEGWNTRLARCAIPTRIIGSDADGTPTDHGVGYLRRADLTHGLDGGQDANTRHGGSADLGVLFRAAAWLSGHPDRDRRRCFPDVRTTSSSGGEGDAVTAALAACQHTPWQAIPDNTTGLRWSGWPQIAGVGPAAVSLYLWATHHRPPTITGIGGTSTAVGSVVGPQLLDQQAVASLVHVGWVGEPVAARFTWAWYLRYCELLHDWARQGEVAVELIEMWLVKRWRERTDTRRSLHAQWHR